MISVGDAGMHEVKQFGILSIWLGAQTALLFVLQLLFPDLSFWYHSIWVLLVVFALSRSFLQDWTSIYRFDNEFPALPSQTVRLAVNIIIGFVLLQIVQLACNVSYESVIKDAKALSIFEDKAIRCGCMGKVCKVLIGSFSKCLAVCRIRLQVTALEFAIAFSQALATWLFGQGWWSFD